MCRKFSALLVFFVFAAEINAAQFGVNLGASEGDVTATTDYFGPETSYDFTVKTGQFAFAFNACEECRFVNYRLHAGYMGARVDYGLLDMEDDGRGVFITNTIGFKVLKTSSVRLWVGASGHFGLMNLKGDISYNDIATFVGYGPTIGLDLDIPDGTTISFEVEFRDFDVTTDQDVVDKYTIDDVAFSLTVLF